MNMTVVECSRLTRQYGQHKALHELTLQIEANKITGLIGKNGAGKTTLMKILAGYLRASSGEVKVFGERPFDSLKVSANALFIDDHMPLPSSLDLEEILAVAGTFYPHWDHTLAKRLLDYFALPGNTRYPRLSKGMKSTFNGILGLCSRCALTIFDEPANGMDAAVRKDFYRALLKDYMDHPRTILISSHYLSELEHLLEDVILLRNGTLLHHLPVDDLKQYAIGLKGKAAALAPMLDRYEVLYRKSMGIDSLYAVVKNPRVEGLPQRFMASGIELTPVSATDLSIYLTHEGKGGIDDVFNHD